jgi:hypothetical protein
MRRQPIRTILGSSENSAAANQFNEGEFVEFAKRYFNRVRRCLSVFDEQNIEQRIPIASLDERHEHSEALSPSVRAYLSII